MPPSVGQAYQALQGFQQQSPEDIISQTQSQYGLPAMQSQLDALRGVTANLTNSIKNVDPSVTGRTQGGLVTEAQRSKIVNNETAPLTDELNTNQANTNDVASQFDTASTAASNLANAKIAGQTNTYNELEAQYQDAEQRQQQDIANQLAAKSAANSANSGLDLSGLLGLLGGGSSTATVDPLQAALGYAQSAKSGLLQNGNVQPFAREAVLAKLAAPVSAGGFGLNTGKYDNKGNLIPNQQAMDLIYKTVFPDNWSSSGNSTAATQSAINSAAGLKLAGLNSLGAK